jgi:CDP-paratose 2-epimerase
MLGSPRDKQVAEDCLEMRLLITGGSGFVGYNLAKYFLSGGHKVIVLDNLHRRGSERNVAPLAAIGGEFVHGDVRNSADLDGLEGEFDVLIEASAEPSVHAGIGASPRYVIDTNLTGALNCLEFARARCGALVFLSTSRIYSINALQQIPLIYRGTRLDVAEEVSGQGLSTAGISETFPHNEHRSYYGGSKLAAEIMCQEYGAASSIKTVINRCGVIAGPGQFGRTDQGVFTLWVARHHFKRTLKYTGFGGEGLQVRDLLHPNDLCSLIETQIANLDRAEGKTYNIGGGRLGSVSLHEFTALCQEATGHSVHISSQPETGGVDIPWYITDHGAATSELGWSPKKRPFDIACDIAAWVRENEAELEGLIV